MLNLRTLILGQPRTCPQTGLQNEPRYSEKLSEFGTVNWTPYLKANNVGDNVVNAVKKHDVLIEVQKDDITMYQNYDRRNTIFW